jgi:hypothetical protein
MYIYLIIILAVVSRFFPHLPNFAPITALAIFSAATLDWKKSVGLTLAIRFISDLFLGFFSWPLMLAVYASHLVGVLFGLWVKESQNYKILKITASSLGSSGVFFLVTNFAFLYSEYEHNLSGIILAYTNGLPFLKGTVVGDLAYTLVLFGAYAVVVNAYKIKQKLKLVLSYGN